MDDFRSRLVMRLPLALRGARVSVGRRAGFGLCLIVLLAAGTGFALVVHGRAQPATLVAATDSVGGAGGEGGSAGGDGGSTGRGGVGGVGRSDPVSSATSVAVASPTAHQIVVDVEGKVEHPGVHSVASGARIEDVIAAAGGALPGVDLTSLDLAERVSDGMQIRVGLPGPAAAQGGGESSGGASPAADAAEPVDLNQATAAQLDALPGIGPALAARIIAWRTAHGDFTSVQDLGHVPGFGGKKLTVLAPLVRV